MVIGKMKPTATVVAQFAAGVEIEAIQHDGKIFLPIMGMGTFTSTEEPSTKTETSKPAETKESKDSKDKGSKTTTASRKDYTKEELMEIDSKELAKILKKDFGVNPDDYDGKNTNKKLRDLILAAQEGTLDDEEEETDEEDDASDDAEDDGLTNQVAEILEDFDAGKKNKKKTVSAICALVDDADSDKVAELVKSFEDDGDADIDETAAEIAKVLSGDAEEDDEEEEKPSKSKRGKKSKDEDLVSVKDLEVGDRVSVWWDDDNKEWFDGEVKSIKKGKVTIAYDDDTEEVIDPEIHTKIKRLAE